MNSFCIRNSAAYTFSIVNFCITVRMRRMVTLSLSSTWSWPDSRRRTSSYSLSMMYWTPLGTEANMLSTPIVLCFLTWLLSDSQVTRLFPNMSLVMSFSTRAACFSTGQCSAVWRMSPRVLTVLPGSPSCVLIYPSTPTSIKSKDASGWSKNTWWYWRSTDFSSLPSAESGCSSMSFCVAITAIL